MSISRDELFKKAMEMRKQEKEKKAAKDSFSGEDYEQIVYTSVPSNGVKLFRMYGNPLLTRMLPTDPKLSNISMIMGDNDKMFRCIWPLREEQPNWILWKIFDTVMEGTWEKTKDNKNIKILKHRKTHPECVRRVEKNNRDNKFERGWYPSKLVNFNIIDRHDQEYHAKNKKSKLLSKKASEIGDSGKFWYDPGIPEMAYTLIWDQIVEYFGRWDHYDIGISKQDSAPWYNVFHGVDDKVKLTQEIPEFEKYHVEGPMTEEEKAYELYDLDRIYQITSYHKIKSKLGEFIKKVDVDFKKNFSEELEKLVEQEKEEYEKRNAAIQAEKAVEEKVYSTTVLPKKEEIVEQVEKKKEAPTIRSRVVKERNPVKPPINWDSLLDGSFNGTEYLGVAEMTDDEKSMVISVREDGSFEYVKYFKDHKLDIMENPRSTFKSPDLFHIDPLNGDLF